MITSNSNYITIQEATDLIRTHMTKRPRLEKLERYFLGKHDILNRVIEDASKPNNKIISNLPSFAIGIRTGYFSGEPLTITSEDEQETHI